MTSITIPNSVRSIGTAAFVNNALSDNVFIYNRKSGGSIDYTSLNSYAGADRGTITIPNTVKEIGREAVSYTGIRGITIPDSVTSIGAYAFRHNRFTSVTIPDSVTNIGDYAFDHNDLTNVTISDGVTSIGEFAFSYNELKNVTIPSSVTSIGSDAFNENKLISVTIEGKSNVTEFIDIINNVNYTSSQWKYARIFGWAPGYSDANIIWTGKSS